MPIEEGDGRKGGKAHSGPQIVRRTVFGTPQSLMEEMVQMKERILEAAGDPEAINAIIKEEMSMTREGSSAVNTSEAVRRPIWLCEKYLNEQNRYGWRTHETTVEMMDNMAGYFHMSHGVLSPQEIADVLWVMATMGCRPLRLLQALCGRIEKMWDHLKPNEFADVTFAYGQLRVESTQLIIYLDKYIQSHFEDETYSLNKFLPRDLAQVCFGYAMMDPALHNYKTVWTLNSHMNTLGTHVKWSDQELLQLLKYDVGMRYINKEWSLSLTGDLAQACDDAFLASPKPTEPYVDPLWNEIGDALTDMLWAEAFYYKNIEGYHLPFSFWGWQGSPLLLEPQGRLQFGFLDNGHHMLGDAMLRRNSLDAIIVRFAEIPYHKWPDTKHLRLIKVRTELNKVGMHNSLRAHTWNQILDPHFHNTRFKGHRTV